MRLKLTITLMVIFITTSLFAQQTTNKMIFKNDEIQITFPGEYKIDDVKEYHKTGYFSKSIEHIQFCKQEPQPEYVQQVYSESGYLCSMYILPQIEQIELEKEIKKVFEPKKALASLSELEKLTINEHAVLKWRYQIGKTRLDHYMLRTKNNYYLFISSPYGSNGYIEDIILNLKM